MELQKLTIREWAPDDRPREKLLRKSPNSLTDTELLAVLIGSGTPKYNAVDLAREILKLGNNDLGAVGKIPISELRKIPGIGPAKAVSIAAALELGKRRQALNALGASITDKPLITSSREVASFLQTLLRDLNHEVFTVLFLNRGNRVTHFETISQGGISSTIVDPRLLFKIAIRENAVSLILCHNHPSGRLQPSQADKDLTQKLKNASKFLDINILDHIIVGDEGYFSFADHGIL